MEKELLKENPFFIYFLLATFAFFIRWLLKLDSSKDMMDIFFAMIIGEGYIKKTVRISSEGIEIFPWYLYLKFVIAIIAINILFNFIELYLNDNNNLINLFISNVISAIILFAFGYWESHKFRKTHNKT